MGISKRESGLNPRNFLGKTVTLQLCEVVETKREKKKGEGSFTQYTLKCVGDIDNTTGDYAINFLMESDLQDLVEAWGELPDSDMKRWNGNLLSASGKEDGKYFRWVIKPVEMKVH